MILKRLGLLERSLDCYLTWWLMGIVLLWEVVVHVRELASCIMQGLYLELVQAPVRLKAN